MAPPMCSWARCRTVMVRSSDWSSGHPRGTVSPARGIDEIRSMGTTHTYDVVIIGGGPAGMCAALYAGRSMLKAIVLERGTPGGELLNTELVEDYPGFERVLGYELAQKFHDPAAKFGATIKTGVVVTTLRKRQDGMFECETDGGDTYVAPTAIITA